MRWNIRLSSLHCGGVNLRKGNGVERVRASSERLSNVGCRQRHRRGDDWLMPYPLTATNQRPHRLR